MLLGANGRRFGGHKMHEGVWSPGLQRHGVVVAPYTAAYPQPLTVQAGEVVTLGRRDPDGPGWIWCVSAAGVGGWVPQAWLQLGHGTGRALRAYTARELTVAEGEQVHIHGEESGWYWATTASGATGWVPTSCVGVSQEADDDDTHTA
jgi:hypothetical protein